MKRLVLYLFLISPFCSSFCSAQNEETVKKTLIKVGLKAGFSFSNYKIIYSDSSVTATTKIKRGFIIGGIVDIPVSLKITIRTGAEFVRKGALQRTSNITYDYPERIAYTYLDLPVTILFIDNAKAGFFGGAGFTLSTAFNAEYFRIRLTSFDYGLNIQSGYQFPSGFLFTLNYSQGLKNVSADKSTINNLKNNYFGISAGYIF